MRSKLSKLPIVVCCIILLLAFAPRASASAPQVVVIDPDGGEIWYETRTITWSGAVAENENADNINYKVYLSVNGGSSWHFLGENTYEEEDTLTAHEMTISTVGFADSTICLVKVVATNSASEENVDTSDNFFTIQNSLPPPTLLLPASACSIKNQTPVLDWEDVGAPWPVENYVVQVAKDTTFSAAKMVYNTIVEESEVTIETTLSEDWYYWRVRAVDNRGAISAWSSTFSFEVYVLAPVILSFSPTGGAYPTSTSLGLSLNAVNVREISFSLNNVDWSPWELYSTSMTYNMVGADENVLDGPKNVYVRGKRVDGRMSDTKVVSVVLDRAPPITSYSLSGATGEQGYRGSVTVNLTSVDVTSGVNGIGYRVDEGEWIDVAAGGGSFTIASDGTHQVEYRAVDLAGNQESIKSFTVDVYVPVTPVPYAAFFAAALGVVGAGIFMWRKGMPRIAAWRKQRQLRSRWFRELVGWERVEVKKKPAKAHIVESYREMLTPAARRKAKRRVRKRKLVRGGKRRKK